MPRPRRRGRQPVQRTPTPPPPISPVDQSDEEMADAAPETPVEESPPAEEIESPAVEEVEEEEEEEEEEAEKEPSPSPVIQPMPRRRGRPPKVRPPDWETPRRNDDLSSEGTPVKRRRGRPPGGGFRGRGRGLYPQTTRVKIDKEGTMADVVDDETVIPEDEEGEQKVDKDGNLLGGREYRVRTFTILNRKNRLYMLSTEPARCCGFRDSYLFFTKHMRLHKVIIEEDEKMDLIARDIIPHSYKGRAIGVVTARSVFREFGAKIVVGGKRVIDDYYETEGRARGDVEGELVDPHDILPAPGEKYNVNQYVAWHGASAVYHKDGQSAPTLNGKPVPKRKIQITSANWQLEHALAASRFNSNLVSQRRACWDGTYDPHTNLMHYPKISQPTHAKWEELPAEDVEEPISKRRLLTNGATHSEPSIFKPVSKLIARNFLVTDTVFVNPPFSGVALPGSNMEGFDVGANGLPDLTSEVLEELPEDCRKAFLAAKQEEEEWKSTWSMEKKDGLRGKLEISYLGFPV